jgi:hypothetical protein
MTMGHHLNFIEAVRLVRDLTLGGSAAALGGTIIVTIDSYRQPRPVSLDLDSRQIRAQVLALYRQLPPILQEQVRDHLNKAA